MRLELRALEVAMPDFPLRIDADVEGRAIGVFGPSAAGKTTLLEVIAGLRPPVAGLIRLNGRELTGLPPRLRGIGYVTQDDTLFPHLTVLRNINYGAPRSAPGAKAVPDVAGMLELTPLLERDVRRLSGGEKRRVAIARALMSAPEALLLDEPLTGLDHAARERLRSALIRLRDTVETPLVIVSHEREELQALCDVVMTIDSGRLAGVGPASALRVTA